MVRGARHWIYKNGFLFIVVPLMGLALFLWAIPFMVCVLSGAPTPQAAITQTEVKNGTMIIQGNINPKLADMVHKKLDEPHDRITTLRVDSGGGLEEAAYAIAADLHSLGEHTVVVPNGYMCGSACLILALDDDVKFEPDDHAKLLFHRSYDRTGPETCFFCRLLDRGRNFVKDVLNPDYHRQMYVWAELLSPGLGKALAQCDPNPFDNLAGRVITGEQFKAFRNGKVDAVACSSRSVLQAPS